MFFSHDLINNVYIRLVNLDPSTGKSRKEKVSGLRYLIATSQLLRQSNTNIIDLSVGSELRQQFIDAVGKVVALDNQGLYTKDFSQEFDTSKDFGVGSNFLTTRLANSRSQDIKYPGRPEPLLLLQKEKVSILPNAGQVLVDSYGITSIKPELCIWLLRKEDFDIHKQTLSADELKKLIQLRLLELYTNDVVSAILPTKAELEKLIKPFDFSFLTMEQADCSDIAIVKSKLESPISLTAHVLINDLPDDDQIFNIVQQLLACGAKGILFLGPPGTSKTWYALKVALKIVGGDENRVERVQFHPSFTYEDFIEGMVSTGSISSTDPLFKPKDKVFLNLCSKARLDSDSLYILIIDEFSRGDPSKIFGELLTYIEPDYRNINFKLPYSEKEISIPQNVVIFATMNPYDKSVVDLDSAMERRFDVVELLPDPIILKSLLQNSGIGGEQLGQIIQFFTTANKLAPHGFGHTYFKGLSKENDFILLWNHKLKFIFEKMFRFEKDSYTAIKQSYVNIISDENKANIS